VAVMGGSACRRLTPPASGFVKLYRIGKGGGLWEGVIRKCVHFM
jgi:hypothetical protein